MFARKEFCKFFLRSRRHNRNCREHFYVELRKECSNRFLCLLLAENRTKLFDEPVLVERSVNFSKIYADNLKKTLVRHCSKAFAPADYPSDFRVSRSSVICIHCTLRFLPEVRSSHPLPYTVLFCMNILVPQEISAGSNRNLLPQCRA